MVFCLFFEKKKKGGKCSVIPISMAALGGACLTLRLQYPSCLASTQTFISSNSPPQPQPDSFFLSRKQNSEMSFPIFGLSTLATNQICRYEFQLI